MIFVTGAGTDVGKTFVACGLIAELRRRGCDVAAFKPLASGVDPAQPEASDPGALLAALGEPATPTNLDRIAPWRYRAALAPDMAAAAGNARVDFDALVAFSRRAAHAAEQVVIEGVGGVMSPIAESHAVLDWIVALGSPVLLVTGSYLGAQTHALTALTALRARDIAVPAMVVSESADSTVGLAATVRSLARFVGPVPIVPVPRQTPAAQHAAFRAIADLFCRDGTHVRSWPGRQEKMRVVIVGQQAFGKAVLDAFAGRGDEVVGVFSPPEQPGGKTDPLRAAAIERKIPVFQFKDYGASEALDTLRNLNADIGLLAFVTQFLPQAFVNLPKHGMLLFHPSLLPLHRGPSAINWSVINGEKLTGLTVLRPSDGLDEGAIILKREVEIGPDDTVGTLYFDKIFHMGVAAMIEAAQAVANGRGHEQPQDESLATYEGWVREREAQINWASSIDRIYDLIRGCDPSPGAWTKYRGQKLQLFDARKRPAATFGAVRGLKAGQVVASTAEGFSVYAQGGFVEIKRCRLGDGKKVAAGEAGIEAGVILGE